MTVYEIVQTRDLPPGLCFDRAVVLARSKSEAVQALAVELFDHNLNPDIKEYVHYRPLSMVATTLGRGKTGAEVRVVCWSTYRQS